MARWYAFLTVSGWYHGHGKWREMGLLGRLVLLLSSSDRAARQVISWCPCSDGMVTPVGPALADGSTPSPVETSSQTVTKTPNSPYFIG